MKHICVYKLLRLHGHSPPKAAEILLDAQRGDVWALQWIKMLFVMR